ncbi:ComF family protein [Mycetohabitans endofungorum]|uniref:ComF family protein n=1 Tax=Mycetohabitans endofungorum TaxID=417203 RepID=UPI00396A921F
MKQSTPLPTPARDSTSVNDHSSGRQQDHAWPAAAAVRIAHPSRAPVAPRTGRGRRRWVALLRSLCRGAWRYALPTQCALCGNLSHDVLCNACDETYWNETRLRCPRCALPLPRNVATQCSFCVQARPAFDATVTLADYAPPLDQLVADLKFRSRIELGRDFARRLALASQDLPELPDALIAVPLSAPRLSARGYNQAWEIARALARRLGVRADPRAVVRVRDTGQQALLGATARHANLAGAFALRKTVRGQHVGIVDDVMTSGATLDTLARMLKDAGARRVTNFVALRTPRA